MDRSRIDLKILFLLSVLILASCGGPEDPPVVLPPPDVEISLDVEIFHSPVIAKSNENVTFTAYVLDAGVGSVEVQIKVNDVVVETCSNLSTFDTCVYTGGPYSAYEGTTVSYLATVTDSDNNMYSRGYYYFGVTDANYNWSKADIPARHVGDSSSSTSNFDLLFHSSDDYSVFGDFVDDVEDKMYDIYAEQDVIENVNNFDNFNFYIYRKTATSINDCGTPHADTDTDVTERDADAILHTANITDCARRGASPPKFTAEGYNTQAFLHESGHGVFGLADEYDAAPSCYTHYFQPVNEPNIWSIEGGCRQEQTNKGRGPDNCWKFTECQGDWWGIHGATDNTVMQRGMVGDPWGIEGREHVLWWFTQFPP